MITDYFYKSLIIKPLEGLNRPKVVIPNFVQVLTNKLLITSEIRIQ
jgi:hypothetical protein